MGKPEKMLYLTYHETFPCYHFGHIGNENTGSLLNFWNLSEIGSFVFVFFFSFKFQRQDPVTFGSLRRVRDRTCSGCVLDEDKTLLFIHSSVPVYCCLSTSVRTWVTLPQSLLQCKQIFTARLFPSHVLSNANFPSHSQNILFFIEWLEELCL